MSDLRKLVRTVSVVAEVSFAMALLAAFLFYVVGAGRMFAGANAGIGRGLAVAGAVTMAVSCAIGLTVHIGGLILHWMKHWFARVLVPFVPVAGSVALGMWLASGDPGDEAAIRVALVFCVACSVTTVAGSIVGFAPSTKGTTE